MIDEKTAQRFWAKVNKESDMMYDGTPCWEWTGKLSKVEGWNDPRDPGYGKFCDMHAPGFLESGLLKESVQMPPAEPQYSKEEQDLIDWLEKVEGRKLTQQQINLHSDQTRSIGDLPQVNQEGAACAENPSFDSPTF